MGFGTDRVCKVCSRALWLVDHKVKQVTCLASAPVVPKARTKVSDTNFEDSVPLAKEFKSRLRLEWAMVQATGRAITRLSMFQT
jgi:tRNA A37 threonylcarbamoyladenosine dehydratase